MGRSIFVNFAVEDLERSKKFFEALGFSFNPQFTDETAACMVIDEGIFAMLLTASKFKSFTPKQLCDSRTSTEVLLCLTCESREEVESLVERAIAAGGRRYAEARDYGFMFQDGFEDIDGHIWELVYMDPMRYQRNLRA